MAIAQNNLSRVADYDRAVRDHPEAKRALCFGDSWFQYPPDPIDINKQLARKFKGTLFMSEGVAGRDSASWKIGLPRIQREIGSYQFDAILFSNGGNDVVGEEMFEFVKSAGQLQSVGSTNWGPIPPEVYDHVRLDRFEVALQYAITDFKEVVDYRDTSSPQSIIFVHTYDYIYPSGDPFELGPITVGPWVKPALDGVGLTDPAGQRVVTGWLLDQLAAALKSYASLKPNFRVVDSRGVLTSKRQWANEIHPTKSGFAAISRERWIPQLTGILA